VKDKLALIKLVALDVDGTFTDGTLNYDNDGNVIKGFASHDGLGLELLRRAGIKRGFITGRHDHATEARATYLKVDFYMPNIGDKAVALRGLLEEHGLDESECLYMGDDINDLTAFEAAGVRVAVANAVREVKDSADIITEKSGGNGAVRELVNMIIEAKGLDPVELWMKDRDRAVGKQ